MLPDSPIVHAADLLLQRRGYRLHLWLADKLDAGLTYGLIAEQLAADTDGVVVVSREAIRRWANQLRPAA